MAFWNWLRRLLRRTAGKPAAGADQGVDHREHRRRVDALAADAARAADARVAPNPGGFGF